MRRLLALAVAVAMVGGSLWLRNRGDDGGGGSGGDGALRLTCATELEAVCEALSGGVEVRVEPAPETADRLTRADEADLDGWLVPAPWPDIVEGARRRAARRPLLEVAGAPLARSRLALVIWKDRAASMRDECGGPVGWKCLGDVSDRRWLDLGGREEWGLVKLGHGDLGQDATALLVLGQAVAAYFDGRTDLSAADLEDPGFDSWLGRLESAVRPPAGGSGLATMLTAGPAQYDAVGTIGAEAEPAVATSARRQHLDLLYPSPMITADVVLATAGGERAERLAEQVRSADGIRALADAGWDVPGRGGQGVLPAGFLEALREEVRQ